MVRHSPHFRDFIVRDFEDGNGCDLYVLARRFDAVELTLVSSRGCNSSGDSIIRRECLFNGVRQIRERTDEGAPPCMQDGQLFLAEFREKSLAEYRG